MIDIKGDSRDPPIMGPLYGKFSHTISNIFLWKEVN